jgi:arabinofuranan 3-O-arabinosyltransferase
VGEWVEILLNRPRSLSEVTLRILAPRPGAPRPTRLRLSTDAGEVLADVDDTEEPQVLDLPPGLTSRLRLTLVSVAGEAPTSLDRAGIRDIELPGIPVRRLLAVPGDEVARFSGASAPAPFFAFDRAMADPLQSLRQDEENRLARRFVVPRDSNFQLSGTVRVRSPSRYLGEAAGSGPGATFSLPCGRGPVVTVDGQPVPTTVNGSLSDLSQMKELSFSACAPLWLVAGRHELVTNPDPEVAVASLTLAADGWDRAPLPTRGIAVSHWGTVRREVQVAAGERSVLAVSENFNKGWSARLDDRLLTPLRLDGWRQGWVVPEGSGGRVTLNFGPDRAYRTGLLIGGLGVVALAILAVRRSGQRLRVLPPLAEGNPPVLTAVLTGASLLTVGGPVGLALGIAFLAARLGGALSVLAGAAYLAAGLMEALQPGRLPGSHAGAFGWPAQLATLVALGVLAASLFSRRAGRRRARGRGGDPGSDQEDGGQARPSGHDAIESTSSSGDVMVGRTGQAEVDEPVGREHLRERPPGEQAQVSHHLMPGSPEDP